MPNSDRDPPRFPPPRDPGPEDPWPYEEAPGPSTEASRASAAGTRRPSGEPSRTSVAGVPGKWWPPPWLPKALFWGKRVGIAMAALSFMAFIALLLVIRHYEAGLPNTRELKNYHPPQVTRVLARDDSLLGELFTERRTVVDIEHIPPQMKLAVLAAEDAGFYEHAGLNYLGMMRALLVNLRGGRMQGGSTITQQVVKNVLLTPERTFTRKLREGLLARRIEQELKKDEILELYVNHIYFGHGRYGVEEATRHYFGKPVSKITLAEAALLAGIVKGPSIYSPRVDKTRAEGRRAFVLDQMAAKSFCTAEQAEAAKREPIVVVPESEQLPELAPEVIEEVKRTLRAAVGPSAERGGYTVQTTIDPTLQTAARAAVRKNLDEYAKRKKLNAPLAVDKPKGKQKSTEPVPFDGTPKPGAHKVLHGVVTAADDAKGTLAVRVGTLNGVVELSDAARYNPKNLSATQFAEVGKVVRVSVRASAATPPAPAAEQPADAEPAHEPSTNNGAKLHLELGPQGALVALDVRSREVLALVGSYEAVRGGLDRTSAAHRQPGSTFKPFVYSYALHSRTMTPATIVETKPQQIAGYKPANYDESEGKEPKRLREAVAHSVNVAAVYTMQRVGPANVVAWAHAMGIQSKLGPDLSLALGAYEVTPREMAGAYAVFAGAGVYEPPILITRIVGPNGVEVPLPARAPPRRVMEETEAYLTTSLLTSVVDIGTGRKAKVLNRPLAGKTGTSNQAKDAWFVGYSTDVVCAVWTGYDDATPLGAGEAGASAALPAWVEFMREAHKKRPMADFPIPAGIVRVKIDPETGLKAWPDQENAIDELFLAGTEPTEEASPDAGVDGAADPTDDPADAGVEGEPPQLPAPPPTGTVTPPGDSPPPF
jgi:penicillin-binding protein 1A